MKICWDNLRDLKFTKNGNFVFKSDLYIEKDACSYCGESFLCLKYREQEYCCKACGKIGKVRDEETKEKVSRTRIEKGVAKGKNNPMFGKKFSEEHRNNISIGLIGKYTGNKSYWYNKKLSYDHINKISESKSGTLCGSENSNWKGGISCNPYCQIWKDKEYKQDIRNRDGNKCLNPYCSKNNSKLTIHHIDYNKKNCHPSNLITVCNSCNGMANKDRDWHTAWYQALMHMRYKYK
jgi:NUMOD3 motif